MATIVSNILLTNGLSQIIKTNATKNVIIIVGYINK
jgi:hypothetical protein